jgi:maleamate amidohydrolase
MGADNTDMERTLKERGFGATIGFGRRPALLVIDLIKAFTDSTRPLGADLDAQIEATNRLIEAARAGAAPIIFSTVSYDDPDLKDAGVWALKIKGTATLIERDGGPELDPRLDVRGGDSLLVKKYASCFFGTDLVPRLVTAGVDTLILAGCTTSGCVRASAVDAIQNGFRPVVVPEAVGDRSGSAHTQSLSDLAMKYADVVPLADVVEYLSKEK